MKPKVSVYTVAYNAEKYIAQTVDSVLAQTYRDFEFIIVNDGSTDETEQIIKSYSDERINYIYQEHKNFAAGMNRAIVEAKGEYVLGVDSDDYIAENYLEKMVNIARDFPDIDYFYPDHFVLFNEFGVDRWDYLDFSDNNKLATFLPENNYSPIPNQGSLKRKSLFEKTGLYEEVETCEDFAFLCKNALKIRFKRVEKAGDYFYRRLPLSNSQKSEARKVVHAKALSEMVDRPHLLVCSPWDNCWLRYFQKYFSEEYSVRICKYGRDASQSQDAIEWADIVFFNWSDWFLNYWSNQEKRKDKKYIAFLRSYEIWDTNNPWEVNWSNIDHLIFVNPLIRQCFLDNVQEQIKGEFNTPTHFIPNGIDLDEWIFIDRKPNRKIAWVNDLCHKKGVQLLAQFAFHIPYNYSIFPAGGEGDFRRSFYFNYITHAMRINNKFLPIKRYKNVQDFLRNKGYALCTSVVEGHPNALVEAMAVGIKPIIHNFPGASTLFPEELVWNTTEEAIKILQGAYQPSVYRAFVETNYDMQKVYGKIKELL